MTQKDESAGKKALAAGAASAYLGSSSKSRILGYHNVQHGTSSANAKKIKADGALKPSSGGTGGASDNSPGISEGQKKRFKDQSSGKVHVTKNPVISHFFKNQAEGGKKGGKVVKGKMSHNQWRNAKVDKDLAGPSGSKNLGATTKHRVKTDNSQKFATKKNMNRYLSSSSGRKRFAGGLARAALAMGSAGYGTSKLAEKARELKNP